MAVLLVFGSLLALIAFTRLPLAFVMLFTGAGGIAMVHPRGLSAALAVSGQQIMNLSLQYQFSVLPLFILMGVLVVKAGLADELFEMARRWLGHFRGGLGMATLVACGGFAAMSASSSASAATMARISIPSMSKGGYEPGFSAGTVAAGGTMGILIPPSGALIIYGLLTEQSIGDLFVAGLVPGLMQLLSYVVVMAVIAAIVPAWAPSGQHYSWSERLDALAKVWGVLALFALVMGGLVTGLFTTTEAGGIGAGGAFLFAVLRGRMTLRVFGQSLIEAAEIATMIFMVAAGALVLNQFVNLSGVPGMIVSFINSLGLSPFMVLIFFIIFYVILGAFMDGFAMIFLTVPVIVPVVQTLGFDLIWWGIVTVIVVEVSLITPPVGLNVFILKSMLPKVPITHIFRGAAPYLAADVVRLAALLAFPPLALWLPNLFH